MNTLNVVKGVAGFAASLGASAVIGNAIKATTPETLSTINKVGVVIGGVVVSGMVGTAASNFVRSEIDEAVDSFRQNMYDIPDPDTI